MVELGFKSNSVISQATLHHPGSRGERWGGEGCLLHLYNNHVCEGPMSPEGPKQQQKQSTLGAEQKVPSFCPTWMGNQGRPQEEVARRKGTPSPGMERAMAWRLAHGA